VLLKVDESTSSWRSIQLGVHEGKENTGD